MAQYSTSLSDVSVRGVGLLRTSEDGLELLFEQTFSAQRRGGEDTTHCANGRTAARPRAGRPITGVTRR